MKDEILSPEMLLKKITELQHELEELKRIRTGDQSSESLPENLLFDENPLMLFVIDAAGIVQSVNRKGSTQLGYEPGELLDRSVLDVFYPEDRQSAWDHVTESLAKPDTTLSWELRKVRKDGSVIWVREFAKMIASADGTARVYVACEDITEAKKIQLLLQESEERLHAIFDQAFTGIVLADLKGYIVQVNDRFCAITGYDRKNLVGRHFVEITYAEDVSRNIDLWETLLRTSKPFFSRKRYIRPDGSFVWVNSSVTILRDASGKPVNAAVIVQDITEQKRAEDALAQSEAQFKAIFNSLQDAAVFTDTDRRILLTNPAFTTQFGYTEDEVREKTTRFLYADPHDYEEIGKKRNIMIEAEGRANIPVRYQRRDGTRFWGETVGTRVRNADGAIIGYVGISRDITERKQSEEALRGSEEKYRSLFNLIDEGYCIIRLSFDDAGKPVDFSFIETNPQFEKQTGMSNVVGKSIRHVLPKVESFWFDFYGKIAVSGTPDRYENYVASLRRWYEVYAFRIGEPRENMVAVLFNDISERKRAVAVGDALNRINQLIHSSLEPDEIMQRIICESAGALELDAASIGLFEEGYFVMKKSCNMPDKLARLQVPAAEMKGVLYAVSMKDVVAFNDAFNDKRVNTQLTRRFNASSEMIAPFVLRGDVVGAMIFYSRTPHVFTDIEIDFTRKLSASLSLALENARLFHHRKMMEEEMRHIAHHDALTGLPNRRLFLEIIDLERAQADRNRKKMAILFLDLDRFKEVNDSLGHDAGNKLLKEVSARLKLQVRKSDTIARIGGDEFNIILADIARPEDTADIARNIIASFRKPFPVDGQELGITTSVGISIYPDDSSEIDTLLRYADIAMYHAKELGRNQYQYYNSSINVKTLERIRMEAMLKRSLDRGEMEMYYQPLMDIRSRRIVSAEALARWRHPDRGLLLPQDFIPAAEEIGFITELGEWSLKAVCRQLQEWRAVAGSKIHVTVNLSARQFQDPELVKKISSIVKETQILPGMLGIEITETVAMSNVERSAERMKELQAMDIQVSIDDFGTGYSSLNYLKRLPIKRLKIDKTFVHDIDRDPDDRSIVKAVTAMAHSMKMKVVAEGVETDQQLKFLKKTGCDEMQGFIFRKPLTAAQFRELLRAA